MFLSHWCACVSVSLLVYLTPLSTPSDHPSTRWLNHNDCHLLISNALEFTSSFLKYISVIQFYIYKHILTWKKNESHIHSSILRYRRHTFLQRQIFSSNLFIQVINKICILNMQIRVWWILSKLLQCTNDCKVKPCTVLKQMKQWDKHTKMSKAFKIKRYF